MTASRPIKIIGGGLAGLALGIGLRQRGISVELFEAGRYPRHRVCGEFISGRGQQSLERLGLRGKMISAGARFAESAAFFSGKTSFPKKNLPEPALCLSRFFLDNLLAQEFLRLGGVLNMNSRWTGSFGDGIVRATGRRVQSSPGGWRLFGLKAHARNVAMNADLELHFVQNGYVGLCHLAENEVNICGLFRSMTTLSDLSTQWRNWLTGPSDSVLNERLSNAVFDENSFCSVAGLSLDPQRSADKNDCCIGDSLTMIPPVTGNGMSMAFESAETAMEPLENYCAGRLSWAEAQDCIASRCDDAFAARLVWAARLQKILFNPILRNPALFCASHFSPLWSASFALTR